MFFNTIDYLLFLPLIVLLYYITKPSMRWMVLFAASCTFYMWFIPEYILCLFFLIIVDYSIAIKIHSLESERKRRMFLIISIIANLGLLCYFKYLNFFIENINQLGSISGMKPISMNNIILPIGLSFHTFQSISYVIDVYRRKILPEKQLGIYSNYVLFFPQMVAGPIETFDQLGSQLRNTIQFNLERSKKAILLIVTGLFLKMVVADNCGEYVNEIYSSPTTQPGLNVFLAILLFAIQIYYDFFGYSVIAQGSALLFGITLMDNFRSPYFASNIHEFWKRWHISLTTWFRNYLYIPLGGSKSGSTKHYLNIAIVFVLSGLWHGASWNFIIWGALHATFYLLFIIIFGRSASDNKKSPFQIVSILFTFILVAYIFIFFRCTTLKEAVGIITACINPGNFQTHMTLVIIAFSLVPALLLENGIQTDQNFERYYSKKNLWYKALLVLTMLIGLFGFSGTDNLPFIYFQF